MMNTINGLFFKYAVYLPSTFLQSLNLPRTINVFKETQFLSTEEITNYQNSTIKDLVDYARRHVPFYKNYPSISSLNELQHLPILTKKHLQETPSSLTSTESFYFVTQKKTGGSTATPLILKHSNVTRARHLASMWRGYSWAGIDIGDKRGHFWNVPTSFKRKYLMNIQDLIANRRRCSAFAFSDENLRQYVSLMNEFNPVYFYGYSSLLERFAQYVIDNDLHLNFIPKAVITTAEMLTTERRSTIESAFNTKVFNEYGCGEVGTISHECEHGSMHINAENIIVEVLDDNNNPVPHGTIGNVVVTLLHNKIMPIIRYKIGDLASLEDTRCPCGRTLPVMSHPIGRVVDYLKHRNGKKLYGSVVLQIVLHSLNNATRSVAQLQVIQKDYEKFTINIVPGPDFATVNVIDFLNREMKRLFGPETTLQPQIVSEILRAPSGKIRNAICEV